MFIILARKIEQKDIDRHPQDKFVSLFHEDFLARIVNNLLAEIIGYNSVGEGY